MLCGKLRPRVSSRAPVAFDEALAERVRVVLSGAAGLAEKRMFGGLAFMVDGNMCCGVHRADLILRLPPERTEEALKEPHVRVFDMTGRPMKGWVLIAPDGVASDDDLISWVGRGLEFAKSLPAK
jgi:TfoX/Sxy family transcriptional regulator of competence genes